MFDSDNQFVLIWDCNLLLVIVFLSFSFVINPAVKNEKRILHSNMLYTKVFSFCAKLLSILGLTPKLFIFIALFRTAAVRSVSCSIAYSTVKIGLGILVLITF